MRLEIDTTRVLATLRRLAQFGAIGQGVCRPALSAEDVAARHWLVQEMAAAGLEASIDEVGNVYGRSPGVSRAILIGSHTDSVPTGGWLDGALGVVYGLEAARAWHLAHPDIDVGIDVISFSDEEGRFLSCLGSRAFCGEVSREQYASATSEGHAFLDVALAQGLPDGVQAALDPARHIAYLEAHIEQGPRLDGENLDIGVVSGIAGMQRYIVSFSGRADHAGTTPMAVRQDAAMAAFEFALECERRFQALAASDSVWNIGALTLAPGVANVVPKLAEMTVELRDISVGVIASLADALVSLAQEHDGVRGVGIAIRRHGALEPALMDGRLQQALSTAADHAGARHRVMPSGAIHDAMVLASRVPTAMLFVPSIDGRSHTPVENTSEAHIALGAKVFFDAVAQTLREHAR